MQTFGDLWHLPGLLHYQTRGLHSPHPFDRTDPRRAAFAVVFKRPRVVQPSARHSRAQIDTPAPFNFNNTHPPPSMKAKASHPLKKALIAVNPKATPAEVKVAPAIAKKKKKRKNPKAADKRR